MCQCDSQTVYTTQSFQTNCHGVMIFFGSLLRRMAYARDRTIVYFLFLAGLRQVACRARSKRGLSLAYEKSRGVGVSRHRCRSPPQLCQAPGTLIQNKLIHHDGSLGLVGSPLASANIGNVEQQMNLQRCSEIARWHFSRLSCEENSVHVETWS